jgi:N-acyl homoserine lactone hydrolase
MWVSVRNDGKAHSSDTWVLAGDLVYVFDNIKGPGAVVDLDTMYVPVGLAVGSQTNLVMATEAMMKEVGYDAHRVIPIHEERLKDTFPSRITKSGLRISEICLADGEISKVK